MFRAGTPYRYGFNGKENDNEVKGEGNQQDYGMRIYDPRLGRFLSVDPLEEKYLELSTYQYASNSPIVFIDLDGEEGAYKMPDGSLYFHPASGHLRIPVPTGAIPLDHYHGPADQEVKEQLSLTLDFIPGVGTVKGGIEGIVGFDMAGNKLSPGERVLGLLPYIGKVKRLIKIARAAEKIEATEKALKAVTRIEKATASTEKAIVQLSKIEIKSLRRKAVRDA
ncbi:MAG TPA: RHS repeat-associated core domain-containing protein [Chitinophagaceae bacterium]|nr:RHS repeat-associated core domain-containing protein [Chitinophagaceae bacterium]